MRHILDDGDILSKGFEEGKSLCVCVCVCKYVCV